MAGNIDLLPETDSPLRRLDPRWKLAGLLLAVVATTFLRQLPTAALGLADAVALVLLGRLPPRWCLTRLGTMLLMVLPFMLLLPLLPDDGPAWHVGAIRVSRHGVDSALVLGAKTATIVLLVLVLLGTAPLSATLKAAQSLHMPGLAVQLAVLTYRYIFVLAGELQRLRIALRVRAYRNRPTLHCYRTIGNVAGTLLVRGYERAERVSQAMRCRGFDGTFRSLTEFRTTAWDVLAFMAIAGTAAGLVAVEWCGAAN